MSQRPRGTRDFTPADMAVRTWAAQRLRDTFRRYAYQEVQTPAFEELELFTAKSGPGIISELYDFEDKGGRRMTLRPELTAPVMRMYFQDHAFDPKPIKWFYHGACYRYDRPQAGRYREFWQFGCEQIGAGTPLAYAELIALGAACFDAVGLKERRITIGHVGLLRSLVDALGIEGEERGAVMRLIDKRDDDALHALLAEHGCPADATDRLFQAMAARSLEAARTVLGPDAMLDELDLVFNHLTELGVEAELDLGIARGLDYYTGVVFEAHSPSLGAQSQLLGGGGYDLSAVFDAPSTPTMGFGLGFDRLLVALEAEGHKVPAPEGPEVYFGALGHAAQARILHWVRDLRDQGHCVDMDLAGRRPAQIAKYADAVGARYLIILGDRDLEAGEVQVKDLRSGEAETIRLDEVVDRFA